MLAATIASRVAKAAANAVTEPLPGVRIVPQISVGVVTFPDDGLTAALMAVADRRLYAAKHADDPERSLFDLGQRSGRRTG